MLQVLTQYFWPIALVTLALIAILAVWIAKLVSAAGRAPSKPEGDVPGEDEDSPAADESIFDPQLRASFLTGLEQLKSQTAGKDPKYRIPWFLLLGQVDSRPKDFLADAGMSFALARPGQGDLATELGVRWWFFNHGVVLDLSGEYVLRGDGEGSDNAGWKSFTRLLDHHRPLRPLDGVVLTISARELLAATRTGAQGAVGIEQKASVLASKLFDLEKETGIRFPVSVLITDCEQVRGFSSFTQGLSEETQNGMFGWSSPYRVDTVYRSEWVDEAFVDIKTQVERRQLRIFAEDSEPDKADEVFVFSSELGKLRGAVKAYLNQIFRSSYHESMLLRGIYFCGSAEGESGAETNEVEGLAPVEMPDALSGVSKAYHFVRDLFEKKIFVEANLARPTGATLVRKNRLRLAAQLGLVATIAVLSVGVWFGHRNLNERKTALLKFLADTRDKVEQAEDMRDRYETEASPNTPFGVSRASIPAEERDALQRSATRFLNELAALNFKEYRALLIPRSWWPDFNEDLEQTLVRAYDVVVIRALREELVQRAEAAVTQRQFAPDSGIGAGLVLAADSSTAITPSIEDMPEFAAVDRYLQELSQLERHVEFYNNLDQTKSLDDIATLVEYLFGETLSPGFFENPTIYQAALDKIKDDDFIFEDFRDRARRKARFLVDDLYRALFERGPFINEVRKLSRELSELARERWTDFDETERLQDIVDSVDRIDRALSEPSLFWAFREPFDLGPEFSRVKALAADSSFLSPGVTNATLAEEIQKHGEARLRQLKRELAAFNGSGLTGPFFRRERNALVMQLNPDVEVLQTSLRDFLSRSFMELGTGLERPSLSTDIDLDRNRLRWDNNLLSYAISDVYVPYQKFITDGLTALPTYLQSTLKIVAQTRLNQNMVDLVQRSRIIEPIPAGLTASLRARDLDEEIKRFEETADTLTRLLADLKEAQLWDLERSLSELVAAQSYGLLETVDRTLFSEPIYRPKGGNFDWWDVQSPLALEAFAVKDAEELRIYLARQRARVSVLAQDMAEPLVAMLARVGKDEHRDLLLKWEKILNELDGYEEKQPGNSVAALEELIAVELAQVGLDNCFETARRFTQASTSGDYFRDQAYYLRDHLYQRCFSVVGQRAAEGYERVRRFFNQRLAGKFPFERKIDNIFPVEADAETLKEFFIVFDDEKDIILGTPPESAAFRGVGKEVHQFIRDLADIRGFLAPFLLEAEPGAVPVIDCEVEFRVNRENETDGDQIIEWRLDIGERTLIHPDPQPMVRWTLGDPVKLTLRWAQGSVWSPSEAQTSGQTDVGNKTVAFDYQNSWSLISFLQTHASVQTDFFGLEDEKPHTLKFALETEARPSETGGGDGKSIQGQTRVFVRVSLIAANTKEPLILPKFPSVAPTIRRGLPGR